MNYPLRRPVTVAGPWRFFTAFPILPSCFSIDKTARAPVLCIYFSQYKGGVKLRQTAPSGGAAHPQIQGVEQQRSQNGDDPYRPSNRFGSLPALLRLLPAF